MASDSDNDGDFVLYGTPLEPLEEGGVKLNVLNQLYECTLA